MKGLTKDDWQTGIFYTLVTLLILIFIFFISAIVYITFEEGVVLQVTGGIAAYIGVVYIMAIVARHRRLK